MCADFLNVAKQAKGSPSVPLVAKDVLHTVTCRVHMTSKEEGLGKYLLERPVLGKATNES